jgi:Protein of unknown function (DUF2889)
MPLQATGSRDLLTRRTITCEGYLRGDGLIDIEGHLVDTRGYDTDNEWRGHVPAGAPAHDMWARLTIDDGLTIVAAESVTDAAPYPTCREVTPNTRRLVGLKVIGGFKRRLHELIGNTEGCTHIVGLFEAMATVAIHAVAGKRRSMLPQDQLSIFGARDSSRPALIGTCHSYAPDSPITAKMWPLHFRPKAPD